MNPALRILVVDDDPDGIYLTQHWLKHEFPAAVVSVVSDGQEALDYLTEHPVDAVITDHVMQSMTGVELITEIRKRDPILPIMMVTGMDELRPRALAAGASRFLPSSERPRMGDALRQLLAPSP